MDYKSLVASVKKNRTNWESHWQDIANRCLTEQADFNTQRSKGESRNEQVFDATAQLAVNRSASAITGLITPASQKWHTLSTDNPELNDDQEVKEWFDKVNNLLFSMRYSSRSGFTTANYESVRSMMAFGTGVMFVDEDDSGRGTNYRPLYLGNNYLAVDNKGRVDTVVREFKFNKKQAIQEFGEESLPKIVAKAGDDEEFTFFHCVHPNMAHMPGSMKSDERAYSFAYVLQDDWAVVRDGGYYEMPYMVCRDVVSPNEIYGRSPASHTLPEIKGLNQMRKTAIRTAHKMAEPPLLAPTQGQMGVGGLGGGGLRVNMQPNGITYGGVNAQGQQMIHPMQIGAQPAAAAQLMQDSRNLINDAFYINLFQILVDTPTMTATEVLARTQEKGILLAPVSERLQTEYLGAMVERELGILGRQGLLPDMPRALIDNPNFDIKYDSPITRAQRSEEAIAVQEAVNFALQAASVDASVLDNIDFDEATRLISEVRGAPAAIMRSEDEVAELRKSKAEQAQAQQQMAMAQEMSSTAVNVAQAQKLAGEA